MKHKIATTANRVFMFRTELIQLLSEAHANELLGLAHKNAQQTKIVKALEDHLKRYGHLSQIDGRTGEILLDHQGFEIPLDIPMTEKSRIELIMKQQAALETLVAEEKAAMETSSAEQKVTLTDYLHLLEPSDENSSEGTG